jgi:hypothetical protein
VRTREWEGDPGPAGRRAERTPPRRTISFPADVSGLRTVCAEPGTTHFAIQGLVYAVTAVLAVLRLMIALAAVLSKMLVFDNGPAIESRAYRSVFICVRAMANYDNSPASRLSECESRTGNSAPRPTRSRYVDNSPTQWRDASVSAFPASCSRAAPMSVMALNP